VAPLTAVHSRLILPFPGVIFIPVGVPGLAAAGGCGSGSAPFEIFAPLNNCIIDSPISAHINPVLLRCIQMAVHPFDPNWVVRLLQKSRENELAQKANLGQVRTLAKTRPKGQESHSDRFAFLVSSLKGEVKKKHHSDGWSFSCFAAHSCKQDLF
jgi:hypothetical protein